MFSKREINPYNVSDKVTFRNVDKTLTLFVREDATSLVVNLKAAGEKLKGVTEESDQCQRVNAARYFASAIFGEDQGNQLIDFYHDPVAVITACNQYFDRILKHKITKAQKK